MPTQLQTLTAMVRREFIEHRLLFIYAPLLCVLMCTLWFAIALIHSDIPVVDPATLSDVVGRDGTVFTAEMRADNQNMNLRWRFVRNMLAGFKPLIGLALGCSLAFYYLMTLYQQRKDRSILFWNSLPVRDTQTIFSKLLAGLILCHAVYLLGLLALELLAPAVVWIYGILTGTSIWNSYLAAVFGDAPFTNMFLFQAVTVFTQMPFDVLWTLPVYGWLLLASAWSRRAPLMWALGPWLFVVFIELAIRDHSWVLDAALAHTFTVDNVPLIPGRVPEQLFPGALLGALFVYAAIRLNRSDDA